MKKEDDYFSNHYRAAKFPFSIYHNPLMKSLKKFLEEVASLQKNAEVLVIGGGLMHELTYVPPSCKLTVIDIDQRVVAAIEKLQHPCIQEVRLVKKDETTFLFKQKFDAIYAKEVIEHIVPWQDYLVAIKTALKPGGRIWLSTPNYGEPWLPLLEKSLLELIAWRSGYSRKNIHPSRFSVNSLRMGLLQAGFTDVKTQAVSFRLAIVGMARNAG